MKNKILEVKNLRKTYHDSNGEIEAIKNINFDIYEKEFVSIVGPSGCGKSTLLSLLANIEKQSSGEINWSKENIVIGYMLQTDSLFPWRNILDNALVGLEIRNQLTDDNKQYVIDLLKTYGLGDFMYKYPDSLSGGMRQRVALIRTLAIKPDILLLDEAFSALDSQSRLKVSEDVYKIIKKEHKTAIMVTHDINEALTLSERVIVFSKRPATIKNIYEINFSGERSTLNTRKEKNYNEYVAKLDAMIKKYEDQFAKAPHKNFVTGHAAFAYLCRDFGLEQNSVEDVFAEGEPNAAQLAKLIEYCKENKITTIFAEEMASPEVSKTLAQEVGAKVETIYTIESKEDDKTYLERMDSNLTKILGSLQ